MSVRPIPVAFECLELTALLLLHRFFERFTEGSYSRSASLLIDKVTIAIEEAE